MSEQTKFAALDDLRSVVRIAKAASIGVTRNTPRIERAEKAIAGVAKLIEAAETFLEWDAREEDHSVDFYARIELFESAREKARAALDAVRGGASE